jgi:hypothetical protein
MSESRTQHPDPRTVNHSIPYNIEVPQGWRCKYTGPPWKDSVRRFYQFWFDGDIQAVATSKTEAEQIAHCLWIAYDNFDRIYNAREHAEVTNG